jgi:hypothetical protein
VPDLKLLINEGRAKVTKRLIATATIPVFKRKALNSLLNFLVD